MLKLKKNESLVSIIPGGKGWLVLVPCEGEAGNYEEVAAWARLLCMVEGAQKGNRVARRYRAVRVVALIASENGELDLAPEGSTLISPLMQMQRMEFEEEPEVSDEFAAPTPMSDGATKAYVNGITLFSEVSEEEEELGKELEEEEGRFKELGGVETEAFLAHLETVAEHHLAELITHPIVSSSDDSGPSFDVVDAIEKAYADPSIFDPIDDDDAQ